MSCMGNVHVEYASLKSLLVKEEQILLLNVEIKKLFLQISEKFSKKVGNIIASIQAAEFPDVLPLTNKQLCAFTMLSLNNLKKLLLLTASMTSTSTLDRIPTRIVKSFPSELLSVVSNINFSLEKKIFPHALKQAVVKSYIKNVIIDSKDFANYRPTSNLSYTSKL